MISHIYFAMNKSLFITCSSIVLFLVSCGKVYHLALIKTLVLILSQWLGGGLGKKGTMF
jgi:hypothetical protein